MPTGEDAAGTPAPPQASAQPVATTGVTVESVGSAFAIAAPGTPDLERRVALSRLKSRLFAREAAVTLGRYHLLERVGKGGMGVVWGAWDPKLERRVAIKVLMPTISAARERILLEGQALAKLSHPNVVPIYDVGVIDEQVYLVMEWVRGESLRAYAAAEPRSVRELLAVYRQAGEGLAAAHRAGLIHRDFKPDNAIRGEDGRVRVLDFGLARGEATAGSEISDGEAAEPSSGATRGAGTPRYMAPEQVSGGALTAAADQFAFCVALREALRSRHRGAAVPRWLAAILDRGTAEAPARRFPDMPALLAALDREAVRRWRRRGLAAAAAVAALAAFALGRTRAVGNGVDPCSGGAAELGTAWAPAARARVLGHLGELGAYGHEQGPRVGQAFDAVATAWVGAYRQACTAHRRAELTAELYQRRLGCLARTKVALGTAAELLGAVGRDGLDNALVAARSLPDPALCAEQDAAAVAPPSAAVAPLLPAIAAAVERARILAVALRPDAAEAAVAAAERAAATEYGPAIARAELVRGRAEAALSRWDAAAEALRRAVDTAVVHGDDVVAVEAFARLVFVASRRGQRVDGASIIERLAQRTANAGSFARALLYNNLATGELARADRAAARAWLAAAQREIEAQIAAQGAAQRGEVDIELVSVAQNLALVADDPAERQRRASAVVAVLARALGDNHGKTLAARAVEANETVEPELARARFADTCERYRRFQAHLAAAMALCHYRLGWLEDERGEVAAARRAMGEATADPSKEPLQAEVAAQYLIAMAPLPGGHEPRQSAAGPSHDGRDVATAIAVLLDLVERHAADPQFWKRIVAVDAAIAAAVALERRASSAAAAQRAWQRALEIGEQLDPPQMQRRLARIRTALALRLHGSQPARARALAEAALRWYRRSGGYAERIRALEPLVR